MQRSADTEFHGTFKSPTYFEDLTERVAVKLTSLLRITGPCHFGLWQEQVGGPHFREKTGQFIPIFALDLEITDEPVETRDAFSVDVTIRLGKETDSEGQVTRLISEGRTAIHAARAAGGDPVCVGRTVKHCVFTRPAAEPGQRKVTELHPIMELGTLPRRELRLPTVDELLTAPAGYEAVEGGDFRDTDPHVWSYQQTDPNQHVHAMEYVRSLERFATDQLARLGRSPRHFFFDRARVLFRKPCFSGDLYSRRGRLFLSPDGRRDLFVGTIHEVRPEGPPADDVPPSVIVQLYLRQRADGAARG